MRRSEWSCWRRCRRGTRRRRRNRPHAHRAACAQVGAHGAAVLRLGVHDVLVGRVHGRLEPVTRVLEAHAEPVVVADAHAAPHGARPAPAVVVLEARVDVVRPVHVGRHPVGEPRRHRADVFPGGTLVPAHGEARVRAAHHVVRVRRVDPDRVVVHGLVAVAHLLVDADERLAAVERLGGAHVADVDRVCVRGVHANLREVHRTAVAVAHERPGLALVLRAIDARAVLRERRGRRHRIHRRAAAAVPSATITCPACRELPIPTPPP